MNDDQLADIDRAVAREQARREERDGTLAGAIEQLATPTTFQYIPPIGTPLPMLERRGKTRVGFTPDERRAKANRRAKNRSNRKASQRARRGVR